MARYRSSYSSPTRSCSCDEIDYKNVDYLKRFINEAGQIYSRRQTGFCAKCQRKLAREIKRARHLALLPFVGEVLR